MKGIILAGGSGTRLYPLTQSITKHLIPIYDKPMIYYPLSILMLSGIREILIITTPRDKEAFVKLLGHGEHIGILISYAVQKEPNGIGQAFIIGEKFINSDSTALILGDNFFYGRGLIKTLENATTLKSGALIFGYTVPSPTEFGVVEINKNNQVLSIEEKPLHPKSNYAVPGLYFYDNNVVDIAKSIKPSDRGEYEISSINHEYLRQNQLKVELFGRGMAWWDTGTHAGLLEASNFVSIIQRKQDLHIACIEEIAYKMGFIRREDLLNLAQPILNTDYGKHLIKVLED